MAGCKSQQPAGCLRAGRRLGRTDRFKKKTTRELGGRPALSAPAIHRSADLIPPIPPTRGRMMTPPLTHAAHGSLPLLSGTGTLCAKKICWARGQYRRAAEAWVHVQCASVWCGIWGGERQTADQGGGKAGRAAWSSSTLASEDNGWWRFARRGGGAPPPDKPATGLGGRDTR